MGDETDVLVWEINVSGSFPEGGEETEGRARTDLNVLRFLLQGKTVRLWKVRMWLRKA